MSKKICSWLNYDGVSGIQIRDNGNIYPCAVRWINLIEDKNKKYYSDYLNLTLNDIQQKRVEFLDRINLGEVQECLSCPLLTESSSENISVGPIKHLIYHPHTLCSLNCKYCFYTDEQRSIPIDIKYKKLDKVIKHFYDIGLLDRETFALDLGGGEPLFLDNIKETLDFMSNTWEHSTFYLLSNSTVVNKVNDFINYSKDKYLNVHKVLITSIDCGTAQTYKEIRQKDYYYNVIHNLYNYARNGIFDEIILKYIFLDNGSNLDDDNIYGFLRLCRFIADNQEKDFKISLDIDWLERKHNDGAIPNRILQAIAKMKYIITDVMNINYIYASDYLNTSTKEGIKALEKINSYIEEFKFKDKSYREIYEFSYLRKDSLKEHLANQNYELQKLNNILKENLCEINFKTNNINKSIMSIAAKLDKPTLLQHIFSVRNIGNHKIWMIFGIKIKIKKKSRGVQL